jgi:alpha-L-rhamnosidase
MKKLLVLCVQMCWLAPLAAGPLRPIELTCEYLRNPLGIDVLEPRLGWAFESSSARGQRQTAYRILVSSTREKLAKDQGDLWDTGKVSSDASGQVGYGGRVLQSGQTCHWKVRVWDETGKPSRWSEPSRWSMGLLKESDWRAKWIGLDQPEDSRDAQGVMAGAKWIWFPEGEPDKSAPVGTRFFKRVLELPADRTLKRATVFFTGDNSAELFVNGHRVGTSGDFHAAPEFDVTSHVKPHANVFAASVTNAGTEANPAGFLALIRFDFTEGESVTCVTDSEWRASDRQTGDWMTGASTEGTVAAKVLGEAGMGPWGQVSGPETRRLPARMLRREFSVGSRPIRATAYVSGLGLSELYLNGRKVSNDVLSPGLTDYTKRIFYVTYDVTDFVRKEKNAVGVWLGNGRFYAPRSKVPTGTTSYGFPKVRIQLNLEFADGSTQEVVSDETWRLTDEGPIRANNEYDGEEYDARREMPNWAMAGFDDARWQAVKAVEPPGGEMRAQMINPIRVTATLRPLKITEPQKGVFIFDMGQNLVGWCRLRVKGPKGMQVSLRHSEVLKNDGTLYLDNIRSARVTDTYTCKGEGTEVYEPRFTYHGFRYVEVTGFPGKPEASAIEAMVVNDDVDSAGEFSCSNPLLNRIHANIRWGVRGNYRSIPTDCPQRDERQGWLGDRSAESKGETYLFDVAALYAKWLTDMADAQKPNGSVPDVCPAYWPIYSDNVTWPSSTVIIPGSLLEQYGDLRIIGSHYASAKKWIEYMSRFITNGIISRDSYGDWCVPPEEQSLIHSKDPNRKTDPGVLATSYFIYNLKLMERYARFLGKSAEAAEFKGRAEQMTRAFNERFLDKQKGIYSNGSQTSCVLPLAFGLVPEPYRQRVFDHLVQKITNESKEHVGTGLIGGQWLMRVLTAYGRSDLACKIATQQTYPSWGYMVEKGATTIWELWNGDTADPAMNSGNHVMLVGDLNIWLFENLAGIKSDPEQPGFKRLIMKPETVRELDFVKASHRSPCGWVRSEWRREGDNLRWRLSLPPNTTATIMVPGRDPESMKESGRTLARAPGIKFLGFADGFARVEVGSGEYEFESR